MKAKLLAVITVLSLLFCTGCSVISFDTQNLMSPPRATGEKADIQRIIEENGGNYTLKYPQKGEHRSAVIMHDLSADGKEEAVAFYKTSGIDVSPDITVIFMDDVSGEWQKVAAFQNSAAEVERVCFADFDGDGRDEILVGWSNYAAGSNQATVFQYKNGEVKPWDVEYTYTDLALSDFDGDGATEIFLGTVSTSEKPAATGRLIKYSPSAQGLSNVGEVEMDPGSLQYASFSVGYLLENQKAVFIDGARAGGNLSTEVVYWDSANQVLRSPFYTSAKSEKWEFEFLRPTTTVCKDINGDGVMEIPTTRQMPGNYYEQLTANNVTVEKQLAEAKTVACYVTQWNQYKPSDNSLTPIMNMYINYTDGYYFVMPDDWLDHITGKQETETRTFTFSEWVVDAGGVGAAGAAVLKIQVFSSEEWETGGTATNGFVKLLEANGKIYAASVPDPSNAYALSYSEIESRLKLINPS